ncbi:MAG TPA: hypothetical protein VK505_03595 [Steroidobacteraceae bacterium]|jgi:hypothetical protein|nr:hypothetical protein [Steroidobacteraceae bacterium]
MSQRDPIRVFVTHAFELNDDYLRVFEFLESARNFYYRNCGGPEQRPVNTSVEGLHEALRQQMANTEVVVALSALYTMQRDLLMFQLNYAKASEKPVVLLPGFGREVLLPPAVIAMSDERAKWDERGLVDVIRHQARHEETTRWDSIEFKID